MFAIGIVILFYFISVAPFCNCIFHLRIIVLSVARITSYARQIVFAFFAGTMLHSHAFYTKPSGERNDESHCNLQEDGHTIIARDRRG